MTSKAHALARDALVRALTTYTGIATADGLADGTTIVDENLDGRNDFITEKTILIMSGDAQYEDRGALSFVNSHPATITVASAFKDSAGNPAQIKAGTIFRVLNISSVEIDVVAIKTQTDPKVMGRLQIVHTTIDLNQAEGTYDLFTGTTQDVVVEKLVIRMPNAAAGGALTSISIQTDDTTPQVFISSTNGALANLTAEAQLAWTGAILIDAGTEAKIQLTIAGGAHGSEYICDVIAEYRAVVSGGYLA